ncbi:MAG: NirD/YgiW/YdeI family stress tolerance protein [Deltaproteobacteria bacterium]|jgi:uncharacterized protein (TIGR00156 family)|nr:NirD/YgiW/YdeI family stress tolerance protein [Deltaproteobacteria bacterium]
MKKTLFPLALLAALAFMTAAPDQAAAQNAGGGFQGETRAGGGFVGPASQAMTVADAKNLADDRWVVLTGKIERQVGREEYLFSDATGTVTVEIDDKVWRGLTVGPEDVVKIEGEVDRDFTNFEIEVKNIGKAPA